MDELQSKLRPGNTVVVARFFRLGRSRDHLIKFVGDFNRLGIHFKALDLGVDSTTPASKMVLQIFAALAQYGRESILEKTSVDQLLAVAKGKHIGRPKGINSESFSKVKKAIERGLSVNETVGLTGFSISTVKLCVQIKLPLVSKAFAKAWNNFGAASPAFCRQIKTESLDVGVRPCFYKCNSTGCFVCYVF